MMKILNYTEVNGTQDRDDTVVIAKVMHQDSAASTSQFRSATEGPNETIMVVSQPFQNSECSKVKDVVGV
jgi:hypothetical protein